MIKFENDNVLCTNCRHKEVCKNREQYIRAQAVINEATVSILGLNNEANELIKIKDIPWIIIPNLKCVNYDTQYSNIRGGGIND